MRARWELLTRLLGRLRGGTVLRAPVLGLLNLQGAAGVPFRDEDRAALAPLFTTLWVCDGAVPACDVLFVYATVHPDGRVAGVHGGMRSLVRDSGARVVVFATDNPADGYLAAGRQGGDPPTSLVMTLARKGPAFAAFYRSLFTMMMDGTPMQGAWVKLAPQVPGATGEGVPDAIFAPELGDVRFRR